MNSVTEAPLGVKNIDYQGKNYKVILIAKESAPELILKDSKSRSAEQKYAENILKFPKELQIKKVHKRMFKEKSNSLKEQLGVPRMTKAIRDDNAEFMTITDEMIEAEIARLVELAYGQG